MSLKASLLLLFMLVTPHLAQRGCMSFDVFFNPTFDGTCNNLGFGGRQCRRRGVRPNVNWGASGSAYERLLPPTYGDLFENERRDDEEPEVGEIAGSTSNPRARCSTSRSGDALPPPRIVTTNFHQIPANAPDDRDRTQMMVFFGQFLVHDLSFIRGGSTSSPCCPLNPSESECLALEVPANDPFFGPRNIDCLNNVRSVNVNEGSRRQREQFNRATSVIDASPLYGSGPENTIDIEELADFSTGRMITRLVNGKQFPPLGDDGNPLSAKCGDGRCTLVPGLFAMHVLFIREHNRIVDSLPNDMSPRTKFDVARRIVMAEMQNVVYNEYLPAVLGSQRMREFGLELPSDRRTSRYDPCVNPTGFNAFVTAAMRFGHSQIPRNLDQVDPANRNVDGGFDRYRTSFFNLSITEERSGNNLEWIVAGGAIQNAKETDQLFVEDMTNFLFARQADNFDFGNDLISTNINRGRDHGLAGYMRFRKACGLDVACRGWRDRPDNIAPSKWADLQALYSTPNDIDLFTGGSAEDRVRGGAVGETFACIIGKQFQHTKSGDRFFFTHNNHMTGLSRQQVRSVRARTLRDIICENTDIAETRMNVFLTGGRSNPFRSCSNINRLEVSIMEDSEHWNH